MFSNLPKNERKSSILVYHATRIEHFRSFFGRIESKIICFWNFLAFNYTVFLSRSTFNQSYKLCMLRNKIINTKIGKVFWGLFDVFKFFVFSKLDLFVDQAPKQKEIILFDLFNCAQLCGLVFCKTSQYSNRKFSCAFYLPTQLS